jgi:hypothetical protein
MKITRNTFFWSLLFSILIISCNSGNPGNRELVKRILEDRTLDSVSAKAGVLDKAIKMLRNWAEKNK